MNEGAIASLDVSEHVAPARLGRARLDPEAAFAAASASREPGERLLAQTLQSLGWFAGSALALAFTVDERGRVEVAMMHSAPGHDRRDAVALIDRLRLLEPIDPFSPRRAEARRASVMSAADVGGLDRYAQSIHGQRLRRHGYGAPVVLYFWRGGRILAGVTLLRAWGSTPFDVAAVRLARRLHPLLEEAFGVAAAPRPGSGERAGSAVLTLREAEVAHQVAAGASNASIAIALGVSEATVKAHLTRIYAKLELRSRTQLAVVMSDAG